MSPDVVVREARPDEYEALGEITVAAYGTVGEADDEYVHELRDVAARARDVTVLAAVDESTGQLLGTATYVPGPGPWHADDFGDVASMRMLAVAPEAHGRGIGRRLAKACMALAHEAGRPALALYTRPSMQAAHHLYESLGFVRVPELDWEYEPGQWLWTYRLEL